MNLRLELTFVDFDDQGEPYPIGSLEDPTKRELLYVLYEDDEWRGPLWKRDGRNNLVAVSSKELVRIHHYSYEMGVPQIETNRLQAGKEGHWFYMDSEGRRRPVPKVEDSNGDKVSLRDIPRS